MARRNLLILKQLLQRSSSESSSSSSLLNPSIVGGGLLGNRYEPKRSVTYMPRPGDGKPRAVTLIPGDGIGPLVTGAVEQVMEAMHAPIFFEKFEVHGDMPKVPEEVMDSIKKNKVCLKGGLATPVGGGVSSLNVELRKELDLFASLVNCFNLPGLATRHENVDIVVIRENTEGEYAGLEHEVVPGVVESHKVITKFCSERIAKYAFEYAYLNNINKVMAVHKANIMKLADGLFFESCREVATKYPGIQYNEIIVDNCCMQLVSKPEQFDVMIRMWTLKITTMEVERRITEEMYDQLPHALAETENSKKEVYEESTKCRKDERYAIDATRKVIMRPMFGAFSHAGSSNSISFVSKVQHYYSRRSGY